MKKISRLISIIHRQGIRFFDYSLQHMDISYGQQFFMVCIHENPGISMQELAKIGRFDKGTVTKAMKKLEKQGFLRKEPDACDRRVFHLFLTEDATDTLEQIYTIRNHWNDILLQDLSKEEVHQAEELLEKITKNAYSNMQNWR